jgi:excisionase family DNA binding protein
MKAEQILEATVGAEPNESIPASGPNKARFSAIIPADAALTDDEKLLVAAGKGPVRVVFPTIDDFMRVTRRGQTPDGAASTVTDLIVSELVRGVARAAQREPEMIKGFLKAFGLGAPAPSSGGQFSVTMDEYAKRVGYSKRTIEKFVARGMPSVGKGRLRRIPIAQADEWIRTTVESDDVAIESEARAVARAGRKAG